VKVQRPPILLNDAADKFRGLESHVARQKREVVFLLPSGCSILDSSINAG
jgi:hypothetical protein